MIKYFITAVCGVLLVGAVSCAPAPCEDNQIPDGNGGCLDRPADGAPRGEIENWRVN